MQETSLGYIPEANREDIIHPRCPRWVLLGLELCMTLTIPSRFTTLY